MDALSQEKLIWFRAVMEQRGRPRALILTLASALQPYLVLDGKMYALRNFSEEGLGLWVSPPPISPDWVVGKQLVAELVIESEKFPVKLQIVHLEQRSLGLRLNYDSPKLRDIFLQLLEPAFYAANLLPHPQWGSEDPMTGAIRAWYIGSVGTELLVWIKEPQKIVLAVQITWQGKWIYRAQYKPVETGFLKDEVGESSGQVVAISDLFQKHTAGDPKLVEEAARFLTSLPKPIAGMLLWQFLETGDQVVLPKTMFNIRKVA